MAKKNNLYFNDFNLMIDCSCRAADYLKVVLGEFNYEHLAEHRRKMHDIEHQEDTIKHAMMKRLAKEFITPIDREDIIQLAIELDNVTDKIEDILIRMYMYNVKDIHPAAHTLADIIVKCCKALQVAIKEFPSFHKSADLMKSIIAVNTFEEEGDAIYIEAMRSLYRESGDAVAIVTWSTLFDCFEECCDACEHVADVMETVAMKNS